MSAIDGAIKSLMQGVSQQVPRERLDGQVSLQQNMLSDLVRGMRRRPGTRALYHGIFANSMWNSSQIFATAVDVNDENIHILINTGTGALNLFREDMSLIAAVSVPYLIAEDASKIQTAALRGDLYMCNTSVKPAKYVDNTGKQDPDKTGFFFVKSAQYSKKFGVIVSIGGVDHLVTYTTPDGTAPGDAAKTAPDFIVEQLVTALAALAVPGLNIAYTGSYVFLQNTGAGTLSVTSDSGSTFITASNSSHVTQVSDLPARLPGGANNTLCSVGANIKTSVWYKYDFAANSWVESGAYNSASTITGMPIRLLLDGSYTLESPTYEGRLAGNDDTNEDPPFISGVGITGMGVFQGRLVLLSGPEVSMSASGKPLRWYRSTVTELLVTDPINIYSGAATSTNFTHAVQFNKDLLLFSKSCQAVIPSGNAIVSPATAQIVITSGYATTNKCAPIVAGRSLLYYAPRSELYAAALELVPSNTTDSQYTTNDITAHIPEYMRGTVRQATASTTSNSLVLLCDGDSKTLIVHQYLWSGDDKVQAAWHKWTMPYPVACTWFVRDTVYIGMVIGSALSVCSIELRAGDTINGNWRPFSDLFQTVNVIGGAFVVPVPFQSAYSLGTPLMLNFATGELSGESAGIESIDVGVWVGRVRRNIPDGTYMLGLKYRSRLSPTPPLLRDRNGIVIGTTNAQLVRYEITMQDEGMVHAVVTRGKQVLFDDEVSGLMNESDELEPNEPTIGDNTVLKIPVRAPAQEAKTELYVEDDHDMNVITIEWIINDHQRRRRA